jgi:hypothetical protein
MTKILATLLAGLLLAGGAMAQEHRFDQGSACPHGLVKRQGGCVAPGQVRHDTRRHDNEARDVRMRHEQALREARIRHDLALRQAQARHQAALAQAAAHHRELIAAAERRHAHELALRR